VAWDKEWNYGTLAEGATYIRQGGHHVGHRPTFLVLILAQNRLRWYGHVLQKEDTDWVKKCMEYEVKGSRPRGRPKRTWREVVQKDCQACILNRKDAMDLSRWKKLIKIGC